MLQQFSERHEGASWPHMFEWAIERWVAEGDDSVTPPYPIDRSYFPRLRILHHRLGGWLYYDDVKQQIVFADLAEFRLIRVRLDAAREERIRQEQERVEELNVDLKSEGSPWPIVRN